MSPPRAGRRLLLLMLLCLALLLEGCLGQGAPEHITDLTFKALVASCLAEDPVDGDCPIAGGTHGPMAGWDVSRVTDMSAQRSGESACWRRLAVTPSDSRAALLLLPGPAVPLTHVVSPLCSPPRPRPRPRSVLRRNPVQREPRGLGRRVGHKHARQCAHPPPAGPRSPQPLVAVGETVILMMAPPC